MHSGQDQGDGGRVRRIAAELPPNQMAALEMLMSGATTTHAAQAAGVSRFTLYRWIRKDPAFRAAYNQWQGEMAEEARSRLMSLAEVAVRAVQRTIEGGDGRAAMVLLRELGLVKAAKERLMEEEEVKKKIELEERTRNLALDEKLNEVGEREDEVV